MGVALYTKHFRTTEHSDLMYDGTFSPIQPDSHYSTQVEVIHYTQ